MTPPSPTRLAPDDEILKPREGADLLRCSRSKFYDLVNNHGLPAFKLGDELRVRRADLLEWLRSRPLVNLDGGR